MATCDIGIDLGLSLIHIQMCIRDSRPAAIIRDLDLRKPIYRQLAAYGHIGREDLGVAWEKTDRIDALKAAIQSI